MPRFMVWQPEAAQTEGDGRVIVADSAREAAELWADADDWRSCEFHIVKGTPASVMVRGQDGVAREFIVSGRGRVMPGGVMDWLAIALLLFLAVCFGIGALTLYWIVRTAIALWTGKWE